jgi:hypothetical protein
MTTQNGGGFLGSLWTEIKAEAAKVIGEAEQLGSDLVKEGVADLEAVFKAGLPLAIAAVLAEAPKVASGQEKFGSAVTSVFQQLEVALGPMLIQDVQALIQFAYRGLGDVIGANKA